MAEQLSNTPAVCRSAYIHPVVLERYKESITLSDFRPKRARRIQKVHPDYLPEEIALLEMFKNRG